MSASRLTCGCTVHVDDVGVMVSWCRVHEQAPKLLGILSFLATGTRVPDREIEDVLADCGVTLYARPAISGPGIDRTLDLHNQALTALSLEPLIRTPWNKTQATIRANVRVALRAEIAALEALKKASESGAVLVAGCGQGAEVARG